MDPAKIGNSTQSLRKSFKHSIDTNRNTLHKLQCELVAKMKEEYPECPTLVPKPFTIGPTAKPLPCNASECKFIIFAKK